MHFAARLDSLQHPARRHLTVDRNGNRWSNFITFDQLINNTRKPLAKVGDQFTHRRPWHLDTLGAVGVFAEKGRYYDRRHAKKIGPGAIARPDRHSVVVQSAAAECWAFARCFRIALSTLGGDIGVSVSLTPTAR